MPASITRTWMTRTMLITVLRKCHALSSPRFSLSALKTGTMTGIATFRQRV